MRRKPHEPQYQGSVPEPRAPLLQAVLHFVRGARTCPGVLRIALIGSLTTPKPLPKDADVLVTIEDGLDLGPLAEKGRRLKGAAQQMKFLAPTFFSPMRGGNISAASAATANAIRACCAAPGIAAGGTIPSISRTTSISSPCPAS